MLPTGKNEQSETGEHYRRQWQEREIEGRVLLRHCGTLGWNLAGGGKVAGIRNRIDAKGKEGLVANRGSHTGGLNRVCNKGSRARVSPGCGSRSSRYFPVGR